MLHIYSFKPPTTHLYALQLSPNLGNPQILIPILTKCQHLFSETITLPPTGNTSDHKIPLQPNAKLVNIPLRHSAMKKYVIESLLKDMLHQEVIQHSHMPPL